MELTFREHQKTVLSPLSNANPAYIKEDSKTSQFQNPGLFCKQYRLMNIHAQNLHIPAHASTVLQVFVKNKTMTQ